MEKTTSQKLEDLKYTDEDRNIYRNQTRNFHIDKISEKLF